MQSPAPRLRQRRARPAGAWLCFSDDPAGATPLPLPSRRMWPAGLVIGAFFLVFASVAVIQIASLRAQEVEGISDLMGFLFQAFWVLGWSVGVFILGALTFLFLFYNESARLQDDRLVRVFRLGWLRLRCEYELARVANLRLEGLGGSADEKVRIRYDYGGRTEELGDGMPRAHAERLVAAIQTASAAAARQPPGVASAGKGSAGFDLLRWAERRLARRESKRESDSLRTADVDRVATDITAGPDSLSWTSPSSLALLGANVAPIVGVLFLGWNLADVMVLFWAESAVIGFYNVIKLLIVAKWAAIVAAPFFAAHYGGFMAVHFLFLYSMFVRGVDASGSEGTALRALAELFGPLWFAVLALWVSHGISFVKNFLGRREYAGISTEKLMGDPYKRIIVMHLTIIFGGWLVLLLGTPVPALVLLVVLKTAADLRAHQREHAARATPANREPKSRPVPP